MKIVPTKNILVCHPKGYTFKDICPLLKNMILQTFVHINCMVFHNFVPI